MNPASPDSGNMPPPVIPSTAQKCLQKLEKRSQTEKDILLYNDLAVIYAGLKDSDKVFYYLEKAVEARQGIHFLNTDPGFKEFRSDPRFKKLMQKIGLAD